MGSHLFRLLLAIACFLSAVRLANSQARRLDVQNGCVRGVQGPLGWLHALEWESVRREGDMRM